MIYQYSAKHSATDSGAAPASARRIAWNAVEDEKEALHLVRSALPSEKATRSDVQRFLREEGLEPWVASPSIVYAYADGPRVFGVPAQTDWLLEFHFDEDQLNELVVEKRVTAL